MTPEEEAQLRPATVDEFFSVPEYNAASTEERLAALDRWAAEASEYVRVNDPDYKPRDRAEQTAKIREMRKAILDGEKIGEMASDTARDVGVSLAASGLSAVAASTAVANAAGGQFQDIDDITGLLGDGVSRILDRLSEKRETTDPGEIEQLTAQGYTPKTRLVGGGFGAAASEVPYVDRREKLDRALATLKTGIDAGAYPEEPEAFVDWLNERNGEILREAAVYNGEASPEQYTDQTNRRFDSDPELQGLLSTYARTRNDAAFDEITQRLVVSSRREEADDSTARTIEESTGVVGEIRDRGETLDGPLAGPLRSLLRVPGVSEATLEATGDPVELASTVISGILTGGTVKAVGAMTGAGKARKVATVATNTVADVAIEAGTEAFQQYVEDSRGDIAGAAAQGGLIGLAFQLTGAALGGAKRAGAAVGRKAITATLGDSPAKFVVDDRIFVPEGDGWREILPKGREAEGSVVYDAAADPAGLNVLTRLEVARVKRAEAMAGAATAADAEGLASASGKAAVDEPLAATYDLPNDATNATPASSGAIAGSQGANEAAEGFRRVATALGGERGQGQGGEAPGQRSLDYVKQWASGDGALIDPVAIDSLDVISNSTSEHEVLYSEDRSRVVKRTWPGFYGQIPAVIDGKLDRRNATPEEYLERMALQAEVFGSDIRFEGVSASEKPSMIIGEPPGQPSFVVSQEYLETEASPTEAEIATFMEGEGFMPIPGSYWGWYRPADGVAVVDAKPDNLAITDRGIVPLDLQMTRLTPDEAAGAGLPAPSGPAIGSISASAAIPATTGKGSGGPGASSTREWRTRNAYRRFAKDDRLDEAGREAMGDPDSAINPNAKYVPITNRDTVAVIKAKIDENGVVATAQGLLDGRLPDGTEIEQDLTGAQQSALAQLLLLKLNESLREAKRAGLQEDVDGLADLMADVAAVGAELGTDAGQTVQAFSMWSRLGPDGVLRTVQKAVKKKAKTTIKEKIKKDPGQTAKELVSDVEQEIAAADAEAAPTDEMDSKEADALIRRFAKLHSDTMAWPAGKAGESLTKLMAEHIGKPMADFVEKAQALGASQSQAEILDRIAGTERANRGAVARERRAQREADQADRDAAAEAKAAEEAAQRAIKRFAEAFSDTPAWRDPRQAAGVAALLKEYLKKPFDDLEARLVALGVKAETAPLVRQLADEEARRRLAATQERARVARERRVNRLLDDLRPKKGSARNLALNDKVSRERFLRTILRARENGVLDSAEFQDAYAEAFGYRLTPAIVEKLTRLAEEALAAPEGFIKQDKARQLLAEVAHVEGIAVADVATSMWYANLLSGLNTQAINIAGSGLHLMTRLAAAMAVDPKGAGAALSGVIGALPVALRDARATLKDASEAVKMHEKYGKPGALELLASLTPEQASTLPGILKATRPLAKVLRYVFRALAAGDMFWYRTASEGRAWLAASRIARSGAAGSKAQIASEMARLLGTDRVNDAAVTAQADILEAYGTLEGREGDVYRRLYEIVEQGRPDAIREEAHQWATLVTYTGDPQGMLGEVAKGINFMLAKAVIPTRFGDIPLLRFTIPFVNIVANVANATADYTPIGFVRAVNGSHLVNPQREFTDIERKELMMTSVIGSGAAAVIAGMAEGGLDEDDPAFAIYAEGPPDKNKRRQMMAAGWRPYSIKIGDTYVKFHETPLAVPLAIIGAWHDMRRFSPAYANKNTLEKLSVLTAASFGAFSESGFLSSVSDLMDMLQGKRGVGDFAARSAKGFIPLQGLLRDVVTRPFDPATIEADSLWAAFIRDVPFVQHVGTRPMLNAFGEPVEKPIGERIPIWSRFASTRSVDPEWRWLAANRLAIPGGTDEITISLANATAGQKVALERVKEGRTEQIGRFAANVMTDDERHEFVRTSGPLVKAAVQKLMARYPEPGEDRETVQDAIDKETARIRREVKLEMLGLK